MKKWFVPYTLMALLVAGLAAASESDEKTPADEAKGVIRGIHHVAMSTVDLERSLAFYRDLLGFKLVARASWPVGRGADAVTGLKDSSGSVAILRLGNAHIELFEFSSPTPKPADPNRPASDHGFTHLALDVKNVDAVYKRLKAAGMRFHAPPQPIGGGSRGTYGRDPDGNIIEIIEIPNIPGHPLSIDKNLALDDTPSPKP